MYYDPNAVSPLRKFGLQAKPKAKGFPEAFVSPYVRGNYAYLTANHPLAGGDFLLSKPDRPNANFLAIEQRSSGDSGGKTGDTAQGYLSADHSWFVLSQEAEVRRAERENSRARGAIHPPKSTQKVKLSESRARREALLTQLDSLDSRYDYGRIQAEIQELRARFPEHAGLQKDTGPDDGLPNIQIRDAEGKVLLEGKARSPEELIAKALKKAADSPDPNKRVLNLDGAQLDEKTWGRKLNFEGMNMQNMSMRRADLGGAIFKDTQMKNIDMTECNLKGATIDKCHMENVNMQGFTGDKDTRIRNSSMYNVDMSFADAPEIKMENIRAEYLNIQGANFAGAHLEGVHVENLWAKDVNLDNAKIGDLRVSGRQSSLEGARMNGAEIGNSSFGTKDYGINMKDIKANRSVWTDVQFNASDLSKSEFNGAVFTRVDMRRVVTPEGPMSMNNANITGLIAGQDAKLRAENAICDGITIDPKEDFVFHGTAPIQRAVSEAMQNGSDKATVLNADGATQEALNAGLLEQKRRQMANTMGLRPQNPWEKKGSGSAG